MSVCLVPHVYVHMFLSNIGRSSLSLQISYNSCLEHKHSIGVPLWYIHTYIHNFQYTLYCPVLSCRLSSPCYPHTVYVLVITPIPIPTFIPMPCQRHTNSPSIPSPTIPTASTSLVTRNWVFIWLVSASPLTTLARSHASHRL